MRTNFFLILSALFLLLIGPSSSFAIPISDLFNTGVDDLGVALGANEDDPHYELVSNPLGGTMADKTVTADWPIATGVWVANTTGSRWIGPNVSNQDPQDQDDSYGPAGNYVYETTFYLPDYAGNLLITGYWGTDNPGNDILLNGVSMGQTSGGFTSLSAFLISAPAALLLDGTNTLQFLVHNLYDVNDPQGYNPTGLRVDGIEGTYDIVPEPATMALLGLGLLGLAGIGRRKI